MNKLSWTDFSSLHSNSLGSYYCYISVFKKYNFVSHYRWTKIGFKIGKGIWQGYILSPCLSTSGEILGWTNHKLESRLPGETSKTSDMQMDDSTLMAESEKLKSPWWGRKSRVKKLAMNSTFKNLGSWHPVPSLHGKYMRKKWKQWQIFFSWAPKSLWMVTAAMKFNNTCSLEEKQSTGMGCRCLLRTNLESILKSRDITLPTKVCIVKAMVSPVVMYVCESWIIKKAERQRIDVFELWCWRRRESPLDSKEIKPVNPKRNQPWTFTGRTDAEAEAPIFWLMLMWRANSLEKTLMLRILKAAGEGDNKWWDGWMASLTQWTWVWANPRR